MKAIPIQVNIKRAPGGRLKLIINAQGFHNKLLEYGAELKESPNGKMVFKDQPNSDYSEAISQSGSQRKIQPHALLVCEYPMEYDVTSTWSAPPSPAAIQSVLDSVKAVAKTIESHYAPIDMSIKLVAKPKAA